MTIFFKILRGAMALLAPLATPMPTSTSITLPSANRCGNAFPPHYTPEYIEESEAELLALEYNTKNHLVTEF